MRTPVVITLSLLAAAPLLAQDATISQSYRSLVKPGMELKFEEGLKRHGQWHKAQKDTWVWDTWQIVAGDKLGQYVSISGGHAWADFDKPGVPLDKDFQDATVNLLPYTEYTTSGFGALLTSLSRPWPQTERVPMVQVMDFLVEQGGEAAFLHTVGKFTEAATKANWPGRFVWIQRVSGGETPMFTLVMPVSSFASMQRSGPSVQQVMESAWGRQESTALWAALNEVTESVTNSMWAYRPDLSYGPGVN